MFRACFYHNYQIDLTFEGVTGSSFLGDIAIDDVSITPGSCSSTPLTPPPPTLPSGMPVLCSLVFCLCSSVFELKL